MPIKKFRSVEEMSQPVWLPVGPALWEAMTYVGEIGARTVGHQFPPGVYRHRCIEDAQVLRQRWEDENVRRYQERLASARKTREGQL